MNTTVYNLNKFLIYLAVYDVGLAYNNPRENPVSPMVSSKNLGFSNKKLTKSLKGGFSLNFSEQPERLKNL